MDFQTEIAQIDTATLDSLFGESTEATPAATPTDTTVTPDGTTVVRQELPGEIQTIDLDSLEEKEETPPPMFNWSVDSAYILGGFLEHYNIDLMQIKYMHWWKFKALFNNSFCLSLSSSCFNNVCNCNLVAAIGVLSSCDTLKIKLLC